MSYNPIMVKFHLNPQQLYRKAIFQNDTIHSNDPFKLCDFFLFNIHMPIIANEKSRTRIGMTWMYWA